MIQSFFSLISSIKEIVRMALIAKKTGTHYFDDNNYTLCSCNNPYNRVIGDIIPITMKKIDVTVQRCGHIYGMNKVCQRPVHTGTNRCGFHANK